MGTAMTLRKEMLGTDCESFCIVKNFATTTHTHTHRTIASSNWIERRLLMWRRVILHSPYDYKCNLCALYHTTIVDTAH